MTTPASAPVAAAKGALRSAFGFAMKLVIPAAVIFTGLSLIAGPTAAFAAATSGGETVVSTIKSGIASLTAAPT